MSVQKCQSQKHFSIFPPKFTLLKVTNIPGTCPLAICPMYFFSSYDLPEHAIKTAEKVNAYSSRTLLIAMLNMMYSNKKSQIQIIPIPA